MTTIHRTIDIPESRRLNLEVQLPDDLPAGKAEIQLIISPADKGEDAIISSAREIPPGGRRFQGLAGSLENCPAFEGDPQELVRAMRDEW